MRFRNLFAILFLLVAVLSQPALAAKKALPSPQRTLVLLNWSDYLAPELVAKFEQAFNAKVSEIYFESDDIRDNMLLENEGRGYDLALVSGAAIDVYLKRNWLAPLDLEQIPNFKYIDEHWLTAFPAAQGYAAPYSWGTMGIAYRSDLVTIPPTSWMDILKPEEAMRGKITMIESSRDLMTAALKAQGYSANSTDAGEIKAAEKLLLAQKPHVKSYSYLALSEESALVSGDVIAGMMYSGDAMMLQEYHDGIKYVLPEEGGNIWTDYLVVLENSRTKDLAFAFINFLNEPENAAQLAEFVYYATPNRAAEKLLSAEFRDNPVIYPGKDALAKSEFHNPLPPRAEKKRNLAISKVLK
jgi:spermidine/putrescine transport system substrate-binding protein